MSPTTSLEPGLAAIIGARAVTDRLRVGVVAPLIAAQAGELMARPPAGVLVHGAAGCGVRTVAGALVAELAPFGAQAVGDAAEREGPRTASWGRELLVGWTHRPWDVASMAREPGCFELAVYVPPPDWEARRFRVWELLARCGGDLRAVDEVTELTEGWSGRDLDALADEVPVDRWVSAAPRREPSTIAWMREARLAFVDGRLGADFDDLRAYLERYRLG